MSKKPAQAAPPRWDIRTERDLAISLDMGDGEAAEVPVTRVKYREAGKRGRFHTFVVKGLMPRDTRALVDEYDAQARTRGLR
jgi:hypothetical protein